MLKNNIGKVGTGEILFILSLLSPVIAAGIAQQWYYFFTLVTFYVCFIIMEIISVKRSGKTISRKIGDLHRESPWKFWLIQGTWVMMSAGLFIHFLIM